VYVLDGIWDYEYEIEVKDNFGHMNVRLVTKYERFYLYEPDGRNFIMNEEYYGYTATSLHLNDRFYEEAANETNIYELNVGIIVYKRGNLDVSKICFGIFEGRDLVFSSWIEQVS
jgi:hypothetical protein